MIANRTLYRLVLMTIAGGVLGSMSGALAEDKLPPKAVAKTAREEIKAFCANIADAARDQRYLHQKEELAALQKQVDDRIKVLEDRSKQYENWVNQRNEFAKMATAGLVDIYKKMKPDAAASQLNLIDPNLASAIVMKLSPGQSSLILAEMEPKKAATIAAIVSAAATRNAPRNPT